MNLNPFLPLPEAPTDDYHKFIAIFGFRLLVTSILLFVFLFYTFSQYWYEYAIERNVIRSQSGLAIAEICFDHLQYDTFKNEEHMSSCGANIDVSGEENARELKRLIEVHKKRFDIALSDHKPLLKYNSLKKQYGANSAVVFLIPLCFVLLLFLWGGVWMFKGMRSWGRSSKLIKEMQYEKHTMEMKLNQTELQNGKEAKKAIGPDSLERKEIKVESKTNEVRSCLLRFGWFKRINGA